jgi:NAD(P)-dependent dehydrogenase (short-subunit alcohol dehydrogenase family)
MLVLINNAGILEQTVRIHETEPNEWWRTYEVNVRGTFLPTRAVLQHVLGKPERPVDLTIINTSSIGSQGTSPGFSSYQSSKTAINRFTEFIHFEYEEEGIRTFAYHPGQLKNLLVFPLSNYFF